MGDGMTKSQLKDMMVEVVRDTIAEERLKANDNPTDPRKIAQLIAEQMAGVVQVSGTKGRKASRMMQAVAAGKGDPDKSLAWLKKHYPEDETLQKALTIGGDGTDFIMPVEYSQDLIELLRPMSAVRKLNPVIIPMDSATLQIPKLIAGSTATYIGSNDNIGTTKPKFGMLKLTFKKLAAIVPVSNDLVRFSSPGADDLVRDDLVASLAIREDQAFLRDEGDENTPKGMKYWAPESNLIPANATVNLANVTKDLGKLILALMQSNCRMIRPGWIFSPRTMVYLMTIRDGNGNYAFRDEMANGTLWGYPYAVTNNIPVDLGSGSDSEIYFADFADVVIGEALRIQLDASNTAAYADGNDVVAAFSRDQTVIRAIVEHDFGMRHDASVALLTGVTWAP